MRRGDGCAAALQGCARCAYWVLQMLRRNLQLASCLQPALMLMSRCVFAIAGAVQPIFRMMPTLLTAIESPDGRWRHKRRRAVYRSFVRQLNRWLARRNKTRLSQP